MIKYTKEERKTFTKEAKRVAELKNLLGVKEGTYFGIGSKKAKKNLYGGNFESYKTKYLIKNAKTYTRVNGKLVRWDDKTGAAFDEKALKKQFLLDHYGTTTPKEDLAYLQEKGRLRRDKASISLREGLGIAFSARLKEGGTLYEDNMNKRLKDETAALEKLRLKSSYSSEAVPEQKSNNPYVAPWLEQQRKKLQIQVPKNKEIQSTSGENVHHDLTPSDLVKEQNKKLSPLTIQQ